MRDNDASFDIPPDWSAARIVLDWTGGTSRIFPCLELQGADLSRIVTTDGPLIADEPDADAFREAVRQRVETILGELPGFVPELRNGEYHDNGTETVVYLTANPHPNGGASLGEGEYDSCDREQDNEAVVFVPALLTVADGYSQNDWVTALANVCAHEIAHTLGFEHVARGEPRNDEHALYVDLMWEAHSPDELRRPQRFLTDRKNCPSDSSQRLSRVNSTTLEPCGRTAGAKKRPPVSE